MLLWDQEQSTSDVLLSGVEGGVSPSSCHISQGLATAVHQDYLESSQKSAVASPVLCLGYIWGPHVHSATEVAAHP
jgi:hypothetical protein